MADPAGGDQENDIDARGADAAERSRHRARRHESRSRVVRSGNDHRPLDLRGAAPARTRCAWRVCEWAAGVGRRRTRPRPPWPRAHAFELGASMARAAFVPTMAAVTLVMAAGTALDAQHWPQFRGAQSGIAPDDPRLPDTWSATENVVWKIDLPGRSWSSPIVWGDHVF